MKYIKNTILLLTLLFTFNSKGQTCDTTFKSFDLNKPGNTKGTAYIKFVHKIDNYPTTGKQTWYYEVKSGSGYAISHVVFGYAYCIKVLQIGTWSSYDSTTFEKYELVSYEQDHTTNATGYKFDQSFNDNQTKKYYMIVDKIYATDSIKITMKGGGGNPGKIASNYLCGPSSKCDALPIMLVSTNIEETDGTDVITWITATELNIDNYEVSLITSNDTSNIDTVLTYGVSYSQKAYTRTYKKPDVNSYLYRISAINYDRTRDHVFYLYPKTTNKSTPLNNIFPNPTHNVLNIPNKIGKNITIYNLEGKIVYSDTILFNNIVVDIDPGVYIILCDDVYTKVIFY